MKLPFRIVAPIGLALVCSAVLAAIFWWQLTESSELIRTVELNESVGSQIVRAVQPQTATVTPAGNDKALMHLRQGDLFALQGNWQEAQQYYERSVQGGGGVSALRKLAQAQLQRRDVDGVRATIRKLRSSGAKPEDLLLLEAIVDLRTGELVKALDALTAAEDSPQKHYALGLLSVIQGDHPAAQESLTKVATGWEPILRSNAKTLLAAYDEFNLFPESPPMHLTTLLSRALAQVQECELALPLLLNVTTQKQDYRDAWIVQGYCELVTERADQALLSLEQAYNIDPQKPEIQYFLGRAYAALGDHKNAITFLEYALANGFNPESEVRSYIAQEALAAGRGELALQQYSAMIDREKAGIESYEGYVVTALALERIDQAREAASEAVDKWPETGLAHELLGLAALELGNEDEAREAFLRATDLDPFLERSPQKLDAM